VRAPGAIWRDGDFGVVVLGTSTSEPVTLAGTGVAIWDALARPRRRAELVELLAGHFAADADDVARDVAPVLDALLADGALAEHVSDAPQHSVVGGAGRSGARAARPVGPRAEQS
jgi:hypothetical protein